jgi:hypothetical protein
MSLNSEYVRELVEKRQHREKEIKEIFSKDIGIFIGFPDVLKFLMRNSKFVITEEILRRFEVPPGFLVVCTEDLRRFSPELFSSNFMQKPRNFYSIKTFLEMTIENKQHLDCPYLYDYYNRMKDLHI